MRSAITELCRRPKSLIGHGLLLAAATTLMCGCAVSLQSTPKTLGSARAQADLSTPKSVVQTLIRAAEDLDANLWAQCLSTADRTIFEETISPSPRNHLLQEKQRLETATGHSLGRDVFEFACFRTVADVVGKRGLPPAAVAMAHILEENVWDDRYAEVTLILPLDVRGYLPPMTFYLVREKGRWKLAQWLATRRTLGWFANKQDDPDLTIPILLTSYAGLDLDRRNCASFKRTTFPLSEEAASAYRAAVAEASPRARNQLLLLWALIGDEEADRRIAEEDVKDPKAELSKKKRQSLDAVAACRPCNQNSAHVPAEKPAASPELWYRTLRTDAMGLHAFLKRFPEERTWCAKATLGIATFDSRREAFAKAAEGYASVLKEYPEATSEVVEAKSQLASLYWRQLNRKQEAVDLWRQLDAIGKLPPTAVLGERPLEVATLVEDPHTGWLEGITDFDLTIDGNLVVIRLTKQLDKSQGKETTSSALELYTASGKLLKTLVRELPPEGRGVEYFSGVDCFGDEYALMLADLGKFLIFDATGRLKAQLTRQGDLFAVTAARTATPSDVGPYYTTPRGMLMMDDSFAVLTPLKLQRFNYEGKLISEFTIRRENSFGHHRPRVISSQTGDIFFSQPMDAQVFKVDSRGAVTRLKDPGPTEGGFSQARHVFADSHGSVFLVDPPSRRVLQFDAGGRYVRSFGHESVTEPTSATTDEEGAVYVVGYGANGGSTVTMIDAEGKLANVIKIPTEEAHQPNGNILDIEVTDNTIYVVVGMAVLRCDRSGQILSTVRATGKEHGDLSLIRHSSGRIYYRCGGQLFELGAEGAQELAIPLDDAAIRASAAGGLGGFLPLGFDGAGVIVGVIPGSIDLVRVDMTTKEFHRTPRQTTGEMIGGGSAVTPDGRILVPATTGSVVHSIAPDGTRSTFCESPRNPRRVWHPQDLQLDKEGNIYVYDGANHSLLKFKADGAFVAEAFLGTQVDRDVLRVRIDRGNQVLFLAGQSIRRIVRASLSSLFPSAP